MSKKLIAIIAAIVALLGGVMALVFIGREDGTSIIPANTNQMDVVDTSEVAGELEGFISGMDKDEIKEELDKPFTDEQKKVVSIAINSIDVSDEIEYKSDGTVVITDEDGQDMEIEHPYQHIIEMTDDELDAKLKEYEERLEVSYEPPDDTDAEQDNTIDIEIDTPDSYEEPEDTDVGQNSPIDIGENTAGSDDNADDPTSAVKNPDRTMESVKAEAKVWNQEFYDSLTDDQKESYIRFDDEYRKQMEIHVGIVNGTYKAP